MTQEFLVRVELSCRTGNEVCVVKDLARLMAHDMPSLRQKFPFRNITQQSLNVDFLR